MKRTQKLPKLVINSFITELDSDAIETIRAGLKPIDRHEQDTENKYCVGTGCSSPGVRSGKVCRKE